MFCQYLWDYNYPSFKISFHSFSLENPPKSTLSFIHSFFHSSSVRLLCIVSLFLPFRVVLRRMFGNILWQKAFYWPNKFCASFNCLIQFHSFIGSSIENFKNYFQILCQNLFLQKELNEKATAFALTALLRINKIGWSHSQVYPKFDQLLIRRVFAWSVPMKSANAPNPPSFPFAWLFFSNYHTKLALLHKFDLINCYILSC